MHDDVLAVIAARAALTAPGVIEMSQSGLSSNLTSLVRHDILARGVRVTLLEDGHYSVDLHVFLAYGRRLSAVGRDLGQRVNEALKDAVGLYPDRIVIHVDGVRLVDE